MSPPAPSTPPLNARQLPPNIFVAVMATGIVSLALNGAGYAPAALALFWLNLALYAALSCLLLVRVAKYRAELVADVRSHAKAPGFFTLVAAPCVLGNQAVLLLGSNTLGLALGIIGLVFWVLLTYLMLPGLIAWTEKPKPEAGINGAWLLIIVGTQAVSVLACLLAPSFGTNMADAALFVSFCFWLVGSMIYFWLIALIFHRIVFLPLTPGELTPPYWINMGAMAISTLAGVRLVGAADRLPLLLEVLPFLKGMTLLFWATATWWIPILLSLGVWRHVIQRVRVTYDSSYWAMVFPLGMYTVCTQQVIGLMHLPILRPISDGFVWVATAAWLLTFVGLVGSTAQGIHAGRQSRP